MKSTIKWISPKEELPKGVGRVYILRDYLGTNEISTVTYNEELGLFNSTKDDGGKFSFDVEYWAYINSPTEDDDIVVELSMEDRVTISILLLGEIESLENELAEASKGGNLSKILNRMGRINKMASIGMKLNDIDED